MLQQRTVISIASCLWILGSVGAEAICYSLRVKCLHANQRTDRLLHWIHSPPLHLSRPIAKTTSLRPPTQQCLSQSCTGDDDDNNNTSLFSQLLARFQGDFDNYDQVVQDRRAGLVPRQGGGHEHIHSLLVPVSPHNNKNNNNINDSCAAARLAAFYFDGLPQRIFRFRYYELVPATTDDETVDMTLYCLHPTLDGQLRGTEDPMQWPIVWKSFEQTNGEGNGRREDRIMLLDKCNVRWSRTLDPIQHKYAQDYNKLRRPADNNRLGGVDMGIHAVMVHGEAVVDSTMMPGTKILIRDQLSLWPDEFWIHDRGYDPDTMTFIYGNQRGVPYKLHRVTNIRQSKGDTLLRAVVASSLQWTLGPKWRTPEEYQAKLENVGGKVSSQLNTAGPKSTD